MENIYSKRSSKRTPLLLPLILFFLLIVPGSSANAQIGGDTQACAGTVKSYYAYDLADSYYWSVYGGTIVRNYGHSIEVRWNSGYSMGYISLQTTRNNNCPGCYPEPYAISSKESEATEEVAAAEAGVNAVMPPPLEPGETNYYELSVNLSGASPGTVSLSSSTVCSGAGVTAYLNSYTGSILHWEKYQAGSWQTIASTSSSVYLGNLQQNVSIRARVRTACGDHYSSTASVTVQAGSQGGYASGPGQVVIHNNQGTIYLGGEVGTVRKWQSSTDGVNWVSLGGAGSRNYTFYNLSVPTYFRAEVQNSNCLIVYSSSARVEVVPFLEGPIEACAGVPTLYHSNGHYSNYRWSVTGGRLTDNNGNTISPGSTAANAPFINVVWDQNASSHSLNLYADNATSGGGFEPAPIDGPGSGSGFLVIDLISPGTIRTNNTTVCATMGFTLDLINSDGNVVRWEKYQGGSWQHVSSTSKSLRTSLQSSAQFRALVELSCGQRYTNSITINVTPASKGGVAYGPGQVVREYVGGTVSLYGEVVGQVQSWQSSPDGINWTNISGSGGNRSYTFSSLWETTYFRAMVQNGSCLNTFSEPARVEVVPVIYRQEEACLYQANHYSSSLYLDRYEWDVDGGEILSGQHTRNIEVRWYDDATVKEVSLWGYTPTDGSAGEFPMDPEQTIGGGQYVHEVVSVTLNRTGGGRLTASPGNVCKGGAAGLSLSGYTGQIKRWEQSLDGTNWTEVPAQTAATWQYTNVQATTWFRAVLDGGSCGEVFSNTVRVYKSDPVVTGTISGSVSAPLPYGNNAGTVSLSGHQGVIQRWEKSQDGGETWVSIGNGGKTSVSYSNLTVTTLYRAYLSGGACGGDKFTNIATVLVERRLNWVHNTGYDENETLIAEGRTYSDGLGREVQSQVRNISRSNILATQPLYDRNGNAVGQTLPAPIGNAFTYKENLITRGGVPYNHTHFDGAKVNAPDAASGLVVSYYSTSNTAEPLVAATSYPYAVSHTDMIGGLQRSALPGNDVRMGKGREVKSKSMPVLNELNHYLDLRGHFVQESTTPDELRMQAIKQVTVDQNGNEVVSFTDKEGKVLASCLAGSTYTSWLLTASISASSTNGVSFLDIHIPAVTTTLSMSGTGKVRIYNLATGAIVFDANVGNKSLPKGFYRVESLSGSQNLKYPVRYGDFTYNYYDDAGRLVATVAPKGVDRNSTASPQFVSTFEYNSAGQLLASTSPDEGKTDYVYRRDGQIRFSQNARQREEDKFSYTNYDRAGRLIEAGEYTMSPDLSTGLVFEDHFTTTPHMRSVLQEAVLESTAPGGGLEAARCSQRTFNFYDEPENAPELGQRRQEFTIGALVKSSNDNSTTWYSYDDLGRTTWTVQKLEGFTGVKTTDYAYGPNGSLSKVTYQQGQPDEFVHEYSYDADGRLVDVHTLREGVSTLQARYSYYLHGPLKRTELGGTLQGVDYTYTVQGWLKSINHYDKDLDPGKDGITNTFSRDLFGMTLQYYTTDYTSRSLKTWSLQGTGATALYNGMATASAWFSAQQAGPQAYAYTYDTKYQLKDARFGSLTKGTSSYTFTATENNREQVPGYDAHGNIDRLVRKGATGTALADYQYAYQDGTNKLSSVTHADDLLLSYGYDEIGQMTSETEEGKGSRYLEYDVTGKVTAVFSDAEKTKPIVRYFYDERGQRVKKVAYGVDANNLPQTSTFWYVSDAAGNLQSLYKETAGQVTLEETPVYGAGRIGMLTKRPDGSGREYLYELSDHLGNVRAVFRNPDQQMMMATMEMEAAYQEEENFDHLMETRQLSETYARTGRGSARLHANSGRRYGPTRVMQVQPGDSVSIRAWFSYRPKREKGSVTVVPFAVPVENVAPVGEQQSGLKRLLGKLQLGFALIPKSKRHEVREGMPVAHVQYAFYDKDSVYISGGRRPMTRLAEDNWEEVSIGAVAPENTVFAVMAVEQDGGELVYVDDVAVTQSGGILVQEKHLYPFGQELISMGYTDGTHYRYRYGYQGQFAEKDPETGWENFELRMYDSRLGRWMAPDPYGEYFSPYAGMGNNPVNLTDPDGGCTTCVQIGERSFLYTTAVVITPKASWIDKAMKFGYSAGAKAINFGIGYKNGFGAGGRDTYNYLKSLGTVEGWRSTGRSLALTSYIAMSPSPEASFMRAQIGQNIVNTIQNVPNMSAYELGYGLGYASEKAVEAVAVSRGASIATKIGRVGLGETMWQSSTFGPRSVLFGRYHSKFVPFGRRGILNTGQKTGIGWSAHKGRHVFRAKVKGHKILDIFK